MNHSARQSEAGFTIVEVMVAALLLLIGSLGMMSLVDASSRNTYRAEQSQVVVNHSRRRWRRSSGFRSRRSP